MIFFAVLSFLLSHSFMGLGKLEWSAHTFTLWFLWRYLICQNWLILLFYWVLHYCKCQWESPGIFECLLVSHKGNPMDRGAWSAAVHGVVESRTWLSDFTFTFLFHALKEMATHSSVLAWRIPGTGEPHGLPSMGSHRVGHDWSDLAAAAA